MRILLILLIVGILQSCGTVTQNQTATPVRDKESLATTNEVADPVEVPTIPERYGRFTPETLYSLLVAELAATRKQYDLTLENYLYEARSTEDLGLIQRTARLAQYFRNQKYALEMGESWLSLEPNNLEANAIVANAYIEFRQPLKALDYAEVILAALKPEEKSANRSAAITETIANYSHEADTLTRQALIERYEALRQGYPQYLSITVGLSTLYAAQKDTAKAYNLIEEVLAQDESYLPAIVQQVRLLQASQQNTKAIDILKAHLEKQPENYRLRLLYARLLTQSDIHLAYAEFVKLSEQSPQHLDIQFSRALIALELKKRDEAKELLQKLLDLNYRPNTIHFYLGNLAELDKKTEQALEHYFAITGGEDYFSAHSRVARIMATQGNIEYAQQHFAKLRQESPNRKPDLFVIEAEVLQMLGYIDPALNILTQGVDEFPDNIDLRYNRSSLYEQTNQLALMESDLRHILTLEPENAAALNALGYFLTNRTERHEEALALIAQALQLKPDDPAIIDSMGWALFNLGRTDEAIQYLRKAFELFPDPEVAAHLGEALWVNGNKQEARSIWNKNLEENPNDSRILDTMERLKATP